MKLLPIHAGLALIFSGATVAAGQTSSPERDLPGQIVRVEAGEFFLRSPDAISSGVTTFVLRQVGDILTNREKALTENLTPASAQNDPTRTFHMLWVVRLDSGHTVNEWYEAELKGEKVSWATHLGGPSFAEPPVTTNATMVLNPGNYVLACYIGSARVDKSRYHLMKGMFRPLTVRPSSRAAQVLPPGDVSAAITGTGQIKLSGTLQKGMQSIRVTNETAKWHEFTVQRIKPGRSAPEALSWRRRDGTDFPFESRGGFSDVPPGETLLTTIAFEPGTYILWTTRGAKTSVTIEIPE